MPPHHLKHREIPAASSLPPAQSKHRIGSMECFDRGCRYRNMKCWLMPAKGRVRPSPCPASQRTWLGAAKPEEHAMSQPVGTTIAVMGIDIGKNSFHIVGLDQRGAIVLRQRWS